MTTELSNPLIQYVSDRDGSPVSVLVPIELWRQIEAELQKKSLPSPSSPTFAEACARSDAKYAAAYRELAK